MKDINRICGFGFNLAFEIMREGILGGHNDLNKGMEAKEQIFRFELDNIMDNGLGPDQKGS